MSRFHFLLLVLLTTAFGCLADNNYIISTPGTSLVLSAPKGGTLQYAYFGEKITPTDFNNIDWAEWNHTDYPAYGMNCPSESAIAVTHADGNMTLQLVVDKVELLSGTNSNTLKVTLVDKIYPFSTTLFYKAYSDVDVIETWTEITHNEKKEVRLRKFASANLPFRRGNVWISHFSGSWGNECHLEQEKLNSGVLEIKNRDGIRNAHTSHPEIALSLDGHPNERHGRVIGAALCYSGNYLLRIDTDESEYHQLFAGINEENSEYNLKSGDTFTTPTLALSYTNDGLSGNSRNFHKWARKYRLANGNVERKVLLNSWEGVSFNITEPKMAQMMADIAQMGGELFVMDDGWFGDKYPRDNDVSSLGDWSVCAKKLPSGIEGLIDEAKKNGIKFGIWIEPEMANLKSELYEQHPDWIIKAPKRDVTCGRGGTQVVLDLSNPKVQDFVFGVFDNLMTKYPEIDYIKWDANMSILNHGSSYLSANNQSHLYIDYHNGLINVCRRIRDKYPHVTIQDCSSGGGRVNYGLLPYFDEFWTSDNTDALQRVYMQWGTSYFFPAIAMASHISESPNQQTHRIMPLKYRIDVAMSGRLGLELQPKDMPADDKAICKKAIEEYKQIRPIVQFGDLYRLLSPYDNLGAASLMYVAENKDKAVFFWWKLEQFCNQHMPRVVLNGLDPNKFYKIHELNRIDNYPMAFEGKVYSGAYLNANGLEMPYFNNINNPTDYSSRVLYLEAQ